MSSDCRRFDEVALTSVSKIGLYFNTIKHLKPSQLFYRVWRKGGGKTRLGFGYAPNPDVLKADIRRIPILPELDFDPSFLGRFDVDAIMRDRIDLLHHEEQVDWASCWHEGLSTPLWRFNLHYFEYLLPLAKAYIDTGNKAYLDKAKLILLAWVEHCPEDKGGVAWDSYTISMRVVNWLAFYGELQSFLDDDIDFVAAFNGSLAVQFAHLGQHLEVDLLANHYLENLKALVILACYFDDEETLNFALPKLCEQVKEQILPDGMHFELSPMYHKIVLEDLMRVAVALRASGYSEAASGGLRLQDMCDCLYSLERNANRTPLFNDCGDNVAKSRDALLSCAKRHFGLVPKFKSVFPDAGYCVLERETDAGLVKVIFDTGNPGPEYAMGHVHCDALSFECFIDGEPWIVNRGTYAYQDESRLEYKKTMSHSTVTVVGEEQHECWAPFRVARFGRGRLEESGDDGAIASFSFSDSERIVKREIRITDTSLAVEDTSSGNAIVESAFIFPFELPHPAGLNVSLCEPIAISEEFGLLKSGCRVVRQAAGSLVTSLDFLQLRMNIG